MSIQRTGSVGQFRVDLVDQNLFNNGKAGFVSEASALNKVRLDARRVHRCRDRCAAAVHDDGTHSNGLHEDNIVQNLFQQVSIFHHAATEFDDSRLTAKLADPTHRFNENVDFLDGVFKCVSLTAVSGCGESRILRASDPQCQLALHPDGDWAAIMHIIAYGDDLKTTKSCAKKDKRLAPQSVYRSYLVVAAHLAAHLAVVAHPSINEAQRRHGFGIHLSCVTDESMQKRNGFASWYQGWPGLTPHLYELSDGDATLPNGCNHPVLRCATTCSRHVCSERESFSNLQQTH